MATQYVINIPCMEECPFCNSENLESTVEEAMNGIDHVSFVRCKKCGANGPIVAVDNDITRCKDEDVRKMNAKRKAIDLWNAAKR